MQQLDLGLREPVAMALVKLPLIRCSDGDSILRGGNLRIGQGIHAEQVDSLLHFRLLIEVVFHGHVRQFPHQRQPLDERLAILQEIFLRLGGIGLQNIISSPAVIGFPSMDATAVSGGTAEGTCAHIADAAKSAIINGDFIGEFLQRGFPNYITRPRVSTAIHLIPVRRLTPLDLRPAASGGQIRSRFFFRLIAHCDFIHHLLAPPVFARRVATPLCCSTLVLPVRVATPPWTCTSNLSVEILDFASLARIVRSTATSSDAEC